MQSKLFKLIFLLFSVILHTNYCYSQVDITKEIIDLKSTHNFKNDIIEDILNDFESKEDFKNWNNHSKKMLVISIKSQGNEQFTIRIFPKLREKYYLNHLENDYKGYINDEKYLCVFYGDVNSFLKKKRRNILRLFPEKRIVKSYVDESGIEMIEIKNTEIYGAEYFVEKGKIKFNEIRYFGSIE